MNNGDNNNAARPNTRQDLPSRVRNFINRVRHPRSSLASPSRNVSAASLPLTPVEPLERVVPDARDEPMSSTSRATPLSAELSLSRDDSDIDFSGLPNLVSDSLDSLSDGSGTVSQTYVEGLHEDVEMTSVHHHRPGRSEAASTTPRSRSSFSPVRASTRRNRAEEDDEESNDHIPPPPAAQSNPDIFARPFRDDPATSLPPPSTASPPRTAEGIPLLTGAAHGPLNMRHLFHQMLGAMSNATRPPPTNPMPHPTPTPPIETETPPTPTPERSGTTNTNEGTGEPRRAPLRPGAGFSFTINLDPNANNNGAPNGAPPTGFVDIMMGVFGQLPTGPGNGEAPASPPPTTATPTDGEGDANAPPRAGPGGRQQPGGFIHLMEDILQTLFTGAVANFGMPERDDPERAKRLIAGLEVVPSGLAIRTQSVLNEDEPGCAVCWDKLLDGEGDHFASNITPDTAQGEEGSVREETDDPPLASLENQDPLLERVVALPCSHVFHASCLVPWFSRPGHTTCPTCRFNIDPDNLTYEFRMPPTPTDTPTTETSTQESDTAPEAQRTGTVPQQAPSPTNPTFPPGDANAPPSDTPRTRPVLGPWAAFTYIPGRGWVPFRSGPGDAVPTPPPRPQATSEEGETPLASPTDDTANSNSTSETTNQAGGPTPQGVPQQLTLGFDLMFTFPVMGHRNNGTANNNGENGEAPIPTGAPQPTGQPQANPTTAQPNPQNTGTPGSRVNVVFTGPENPPMPMPMPMGMGMGGMPMGMGGMGMGGMGMPMGMGMGGPPPSPQPKRPWVLPAAPGPTLRQRVERREHEMGVRCSDVSCGVGPTDDDPIASERAHSKQVWIMSPSNEKVCEHSFHPECMVSAERVAGWSRGDSETQKQVQVSCPVCRHIGIIAKEEWDDGVGALA